MLPGGKHLAARQGETSWNAASSRAPPFVGSYELACENYARACAPQDDVGPSRLYIYLQGRHDDARMKASRVE